MRHDPKIKEQQMQFGHKSIAVLAIALGGVIAGAYTLGRSNGSPAAVKQPVPMAVTAKMGDAANAAAPGSIHAPAGHPPVAEGGAPATEGKVQVDPAAKFVHFRVGNRNVKDILVEGDIVWVGTSGGVIRYNTKTDEYKLFDTRAGLLSNGVFHVSRLDGKLAVGTYGGGLSLLDEKSGTWESYNIPDGLGDAFVYDVLKAKNGDVWIATWSGVNRIRGGNLKDRSKWELHTVASTKGGLPNDWVYGLAEGKDGIVWLATEGGLARFENGKWDNWNHAKGQGASFDLVKDDLTFKNDPSKVSSHHARQKEEMGLTGIDTAYNPNYIVSLVADRDGTVWAGTWGGGLAHFDGKGFRNYTVKDGLPGNHVFMLHQAPNGDLWIGTNAGLARKKGEHFEVLTTSDGLFSNTVFSMDTGADGTMWVGSFGGVSRLAKR
ncbi:two-component regulator propeller domain-containing protein [Ramlibacter sp.]|uniref:ligand-binding sensor domain-containing protein n=1 Tax=Ramlibacter sp. TaxID=1917967 RepID=UPI0026023F57|nr:two-component regulator propeller domain-containing protein [Ramlibacter sp.]